MRKIIAGAEKIKKNKLKFLTLEISILVEIGDGHQNIKINAFNSNKHKTDDYIIATGKTTKLIDVLKNFSIL